MGRRLEQEESKLLKMLAAEARWATSMANSAQHLEAAAIVLTDQRIREIEAVR